MMFLSTRQIFHTHLLFRRVEVVSSRLEQEEQRSSRAVPRFGDTIDNTPMKATWVSPGEDCDPKGHTKSRKFGKALMLGSFLQLGSQMLQQNCAISSAVFVARTFLYRLMATTKFCDISRAASISHATNA